jgi:ribosomal protein S18 acetylase RimI-like enzyme
MPKIDFRRLAIGDLQQVFLWLSRPHVAKGYAPAPSSFAEVVAKYTPRTGDDNVVRAFIVTVDGRDAGYVQAYDVAAFPDYAALVEAGPGTVSMDLFLGDAWMMYRGLGARVIDRFVREIVFCADHVSACLAGPAEGNVIAIRAFEKAGFHRWKTVRAGEDEPERVMRRDRDPAGLRIVPIDLARDAQACIDFRRDSFFESFATHDGADAEMGADGALYLEKLRARIAEVPEGNCHVWHGDRIVGQTEMRISEDPRMGYVNLFYLVPEFRQRGLGRVLHDHAVAVFAARGKRGLRLSVSRSNARAIAFYRRLGWRRIGQRPNKETMDILELAL